MKIGKLYVRSWQSIHHVASVIVCFLIASCEQAAFPQENPLRNNLTSPTSGSSHNGWQLGGFIAGGFAPSYEIHVSPIHFKESLYFYHAGFEAGKLLAASRGPGFLRGRPEAMIEAEPLWLTYIPRQTVAVYSILNQYSSSSTIYGLLYHGMLVTPLLPRWNFIRHDRQKMTPWLELGSGLLWTTKDFPQSDAPGKSTSRINFTPQVGAGETLFTTSSQSLDLSVKAMHISSAGLGQANPGINITVQFNVGYSWWR